MNIVELRQELAFAHVEIGACKAEIERLRAALWSIAELKPEDMPHGDTHLAEVIARAALEAAGVKKHL